MKWALTVVLLLALTARLVVALRQGDDFSSLPDQREYLQLGQNLLAGRGLEFFDDRFGQTVYAWRMPGYPAFIALCGGLPMVVRVAQAGIDTLTILGVFLLARRWLTDRGVLIAAVIAAVDPLSIYLSAHLLSETLFTAMLVWGMVLLTRGGRAVYGSMLLFAASVYVRPSAITLAMVLIILVKNYRYALAALGVTIVVLFPWALRNRIVLHHWIWTATDSGITLYDGFNPGATGASDQKFVRNMPELRSMDEVARSAFLRQKAWDFMRSHPAESARLTVSKIGRMWSPVPLSEQFGSRRMYLLGEATYALPLMCLVILGLTRLKGSARALLLTPAVYFTIVHAASVASLRYRAPVEPMLAIMAAAAIGRPRSDVSSLA